LPGGGTKRLKPFQPTFPNHRQRKKGEEEGVANGLPQTIKGEGSAASEKGEKEKEQDVSIEGQPAEKVGRQQSGRERETLVHTRGDRGLEKMTTRATAIERNQSGTKKNLQKCQKREKGQVTTEKRSHFSRKKGTVRGGGTWRGEKKGKKGNAGR